MNMNDETEGRQKDFQVIAYMDGKKKTVGHAYLTKHGNLCVKSDPMFDAGKIGRLMKQGIYVETAKNFKPQAALPRSEEQDIIDNYQPLAEEWDDTRS